MGLDISIEPGLDSFRAGSYSGFHEWRTWLAKIVLIELDRMSGFEDKSSVPGRQWTTKEPFYDLLFHSDCDGKLGKKECKKLSKDFQLYFFTVLNSNKPVGMDDDDFAWLINRYLRWKDAVDAVTYGRATHLEFC